MWLPGPTGAANPTCISRYGYWPKPQKATEISDPVAVPEVHAVRQTIRNWRFYDQFRTDPQSIIRTPQIGTRTPVLDHDGHSLVAALRTIHEIGDPQALYEAIEDAFPGATINFEADSGNRFLLQFLQGDYCAP